jgi:4-hydroxybenzoate polyprenyltransferase
VIYALQDVAVDREQGLYSMPASLGVERALWISRGLHVLALAALIVLARVSTALGIFFTVGTSIVGVLLVVEHALVWGSKTHHINTAFFTVNGAISLLLGALGILDIVLAGR